MTSGLSNSALGAEDNGDVEESDRIVTAAIRQMVAQRAVAPLNAEGSKSGVVTGSDNEDVFDIHASSDADPHREGDGNISSIFRSRRNAWSAEEIADLIGISKQHIYKLAKAGRMPSYRIGGAVRFDPHATADWWDDKATG